MLFGLSEEVPGAPFQDRLLEGYSKTSAQGRLERVLKGCTRYLRPWHGISKHKIAGMAGSDRRLGSDYNLRFA